MPSKINSAGGTHPANHQTELRRGEELQSRKPSQCFDSSRQYRMFCRLSRRRDLQGCNGIGNGNQRQHNCDGDVFPKSRRNHATYESVAGQHGKCCPVIRIVLQNQIRCCIHRRADFRINLRDQSSATSISGTYGIGQWNADIDLGSNISKTSLPNECGGRMPCETSSKAIAFLTFDGCHSRQGQGP